MFLVLTLLIGAVVGVVVVLFIVITERLGTKLYPADGAAWRRFVVPVSGSLISGWLLSRYYPNARGSGIPQTKVALFVRNGRIRFRTVFGRFVCSSLSLASGIALGREGPSVQIGGGIASVIGRRLGLGPSKLKALIPVGAAAALAAAFNTPIAGVLFALEEIMGDLHAPVLGSVVVSSATSWVVLHLLLGDEPLFHVPAYNMVHPVEFLVYAVLGIGGGLMSVAFVKMTLKVREQFLKLPKWSQALQPAAGGLFVGLLGLRIPEVLGVGYGYVDKVLNGNIAAQVVLGLVILKLLATAICYASGNAGGIFGPSLFMGAMLGGSIGVAAQHILPGFIAQPGAYALVGMGTAFAGIIRAPLTSVFMIFELTRDYTIVVPLMISNLISFYISYRMQHTPIYEALSEQDGIHLPHGQGRKRGGVLLVQAAMEPLSNTISPETPNAVLLNNPQAAYLVVKNDMLIGFVPHSLVEAAPDNTVGEVIPEVQDWSAQKFPHVHIDHTLDVALQRMGEFRIDILPVVDRANVRHLKGIVTAAGVVRAYGVGSVSVRNR